MKSAMLIAGVAALGCATATAAPEKALPPVQALSQSPWNGDWVLSRTRNPKKTQDAAAEDYRFHLGADGSIRWEIPSLHEVVEGRTDGRPMAIRRPGASGLALSVTAAGPRTLLYTVSKDGRPRGEGRMTLVDDAKAWVDISQPAGRPDLASVVIYVRPAAAGPAA